MLPTLYIGDYLFVAKWPYGYSRYSFPFQLSAVQRTHVSAHLPKRGDVVVFRHPSENADLIKRVIGLPGDTIAVRGGRLILNGQAVPREKLPPFQMPVSANSPCKVVPPANRRIVASAPDAPIASIPAYRETLARRAELHRARPGRRTVPPTIFRPRRVPAGHVFLMGDNRDDSLDSRFSPAEGGIGMVPVENLIGRATVTFWSTDGSASYWKPWTWFSALRASRIGNGYTGDAE